MLVSVVGHLPSGIPLQSPPVSPPIFLSGINLQSPHGIPLPWQASWKILQIVVMFCSAGRRADGLHPHLAGDAMANDPRADDQVCDAEGPAAEW